MGGLGVEARGLSTSVPRASNLPLCLSFFNCKTGIDPVSIGVNEDFVCI